MDQANSLVEYGARRVIVTITAIFCALLEIVDTTIVNVAITDMRGNLGATLTEVGWVITAYAIGNVIIIPMTSWLSQQFGRRNYFAASVMMFTICSFLCGNATGIWELVIFRFLQGLGGGALLVTSQTVITESYPIEKRGMAQALYGLGVIIGPTLGPPLGGYIIYHYSWPYIFYINIPIGIAATLLTLQFIKSPKYSEKTSRRHIDFPGIALLAIAVGSLQYVLERGHDDDWFNNNIIILLSVTAALGLFFFIWRELTYQNPIVELRVLKKRQPSGRYRYVFFTGIRVIRVYIYHSIIHPVHFGLDGTAIRNAAHPIGCCHGIHDASGRTAFAAWRKTTIPCSGRPYFFFPLQSLGHIRYLRLIPALMHSGGCLCAGFGLSLLFIPITTLALSTLYGQQIGQGAAFTGMARQLGGSFGVAIITTFLSSQNMVHRLDLVSKLDVNDPLVQQELREWSEIL